MSCQQHWVTSGQSNSLIKANVHSKMFLKSIHKTNPYTNIKQYVPCIHIHQTQTFERVFRRRTRLSPELKQPTRVWDTHVHTLDSLDQYAPFSSESHQQNRSPSDVQIITKGVTDIINTSRNRKKKKMEKMTSSYQVLSVIINTW